MSIAAQDPGSGIVFETLVFRQNFVEVSFSEAHDRGEGVARVQTFIIDAQRVPEEHADLMRALQEFVDAAAVLLRNPHAVLPGRE